MATTITLPFTDEFTSLDTELWDVLLMPGADRGPAPDNQTQSYASARGRWLWLRKRK